MMEMTMEAITNNKKLEPALNELFKYAPQDEKYQFILLHEIANQYLHELLDIDSEFHDYSFEEGIKICIEEKTDYLKERFQICTIQFQLDDITRTITFPKRLPLADMTYFVMSSLDIVCSYDFSPQPTSSTELCNFHEVIRADTEVEFDAFSHFINCATSFCQFSNQFITPSQCKT